jgi:hypothetical protein
MARDYSDIYEAIRVADKEGRVEDVAKLSSYLDEQMRLDRSNLTPKDLPLSQKVSPELAGVAGAGTGAMVKGATSGYNAFRNAEAKRTADAISQALAKQFVQNTSLPPQQTVAGIPVTPGAAQGSGAANWNAQLGSNFAGAQMDKASLARGKALNEVIGLGGEFAGGSRTPAGIVLPPSATPLPGAPSAPPPQAPLSALQRLYQGGQRLYQGAGNMVSRAGQAAAPVIQKAAGMALPIVGWGGVGYNAADAYNRGNLGEGFSEKAQGMALPLSATGAGMMAMLSKNPRVGIPAAAYTAAVPFIQDYLDKVKRGEIKHEAPDNDNTDQMGSPYAMGGLVALKEGGRATPAWTRKEGKNPEGGLNAAGRASYNRETGGKLKPPVSSEQAKKSPKSAARRKSFCARMSGNPGPMKDEHGKPTRKALALRKWDC